MKVGFDSLIEIRLKHDPIPNTIVFVSEKQCLISLWRKFVFLRQYLLILEKLLVILETLIRKEETFKIFYNI